MLLAADSGFDVFVTCDQNIVHQQNLTDRKITVVAVNTSIWPTIKRDPAKITDAADAALPGSYQAVNFPKPTLRRRIFER